MRTSERGVTLITNAEGFRATPYLDVGGVPTIGFGSCFLPCGSPVTMKTSAVTRQEAVEMLRNDLIKDEACITGRVKVPLNQSQFDALASFVYNVGSGNFSGSTLLKKLNAGDYMGAAREFLRWDKVNGKSYRGLSARRIAEQKLFMSSPLGG